MVVVVVVVVVVVLGVVVVAVVVVVVVVVAVVVVVGPTRRTRHVISKRQHKMYGKRQSLTSRTWHVVGVGVGGDTSLGRSGSLGLDHRRERSWS